MRTTMLLCLGLGCAPTEKPGTEGSAATDTDDGTAETTATQGELDTGADSSEGWVPPPPISEHTFEAFALWASPIEDVVAAGREAFGLDFSRAISDLCAHEDRLWIGYGDANVNLGGVVPITFRSFASADDSTVLVGATSGEEQVERFRRIDGGLWMPGVDSLGTDEQVHFPLIGGNMYTLDGLDQALRYRAVTCTMLLRGMVPPRLWVWRRQPGWSEPGRFTGTSGAAWISVGWMTMQRGHSRSGE